MTLRFERFADQLLLALVCAALYVLYYQNLGASLWLDELESFWVISGDFGSLWGRANATQGFSPLYFLLLKIWSTLFGTGEAALRMLSFTCLVVGSIYIYKLALELFNSHVARIASVLFFITDEVISAGLYARPYALALSSAIASVYYLVCFSKGKVTWWPYLVSTLLAFYAHYLFGAIITVQLLYLYWVSPERFSVFKLPLLAVTLSILPGVFHMFLISQAHLSVRAQLVPSLLTLVTALCAPLTLPFVAIPLLLVALAVHAPLASKTTRSELGKKGLWLLTWYLIPVVLSFLLSRLSGANLFVDRYYCWYAPGLAILLAFFISKLGSVGRELLVLGMALVLLCAVEPAKLRFNEDWRAALKYSDDQVKAGAAELLVFSGINQSEIPDWQKDPLRSSFLLAPLSYYTLDQKATLVPVYQLGQAPGEYWQETIEPLLTRARTVVMVVFNNLAWINDGTRLEVKDDLIFKLSTKALGLKTQKQFRQIWVLTFERST